MQEVTEISSPVSPSRFDSRDYKRSRRAYTCECMFEYFIFILVSGQFLTILLKHLGVPDSLNGIIQSIISLAFLVQLLSVFVLNRITNVKRFAILFHTTGQLLFVLLFCVPFFPLPAELRHVMAVVCPAAAYCGLYFVTSIVYRWGNSFVEPHHRGRFGATKEVISLASGITLTLVMGVVIDLFVTGGNIEGGFIVLALSILIFCVSDLVCLLLIKNDRREASEGGEPPSRLPVKEVIKNTLGNRYFMNTVVLASLWKISIFLIIGFMGTYMDNKHELNFSVGVVQAVTLLGMLCRLILSKPIGKYSDRHSYAKGMRLGITLGAIGFFVNMFTAPGGFTRFLIIPYFLFYTGALAGIDSNNLNLPYNYVDEKYFVHASAIKNSISGIAGFAASLLGGALLSRVQRNGNSFLGIQVYGQQVLSMLAFLVAVIAILFCRFVVEKQKTMTQ